MPPLEFPHPPLSDEIVLLRAWGHADLKTKLRGFADPTVHRFSVPAIERRTEAEIRTSLCEQEKARVRGEELNFALVEPADPTVVLGGASLYDVDLEQGRAALGFWLLPEARGRGVATHATLLIAKWAFEGLGVHRLELTCASDNEPTQRVALRCGFVREGVLRSHMPFKGRRRDTVMFSLLLDELR